jgi:hypothetical protein
MVSSAFESALVFFLRRIRFGCRMTRDALNPVFHPFRCLQDGLRRRDFIAGVRA